MIDKSKTYRTRDGREVRIYATDCGAAEPVHGAVKSGDWWELTVWNSNGKYILNKDTVVDLIEVRPRHKRTVWLNVYDCGVSRGFELREWADVHADNDRIACIKVELDFEEGEGL